LLAVVEGGSRDFVWGEGFFVELNLQVGKGSLLLWVVLVVAVVKNHWGRVLLFLTGWLRLLLLLIDLVEIRMIIFRRLGVNGLFKESGN